jgi:hypothetical protein
VDVRDVADPTVADELQKKYGRMATPTIIIGKQKYLGFAQNRAEIERAIGK